VIAVILYHADVPWAQGGFLGVDVFFVLSGYLMATITVDAVRTHGSLGLRRFWVGRIRRLMPAQVTLMVVITLVVMVWHHDELYDLRGQVIAGLTATMNWYLIATQSSYFEQLGRPPLLRHLWSLAIEMQFYLVFPPVLAALLTRTRVRRDHLVIAILVLAVASAVWMAILFEPGGDPSRAYYDTFARMGAPLLGAALALVWQPQQIRRAPIMTAGSQVFLAAIAAVVVLMVAFARVGDRSAWLYHGGFLVVSMCTVVIIAGITHPGSPLGSRRMLGAPWLVAIGVRSYCLYLWHWPIFALLRPRVDVGWSWGVDFVVRIVLTVGAAELTYRLVERPWHRRAPGTTLRESFAPRRGTAPRTSRVPSARAFTFSAIAIAIVALAMAKPTIDPIAESLRAGSTALSSNSSTSTPGPASSTLPGQVTTTTALDPAAAKITTFVGDSVMLGAAPALFEQFGADTRIDAKVSRQASAMPDVLRALAANGPLGGKVVVQVGNNGTVSPEELRAIADAAGGARLYFVNVRVPRPWEGSVNATLANEVPKLPKASVIDWYKISDGNRDWFYDDGTHLNEKGRVAYADAVAKAVKAKGK